MSQRGVTLVEVLVASAIFSAVSAIGVFAFGIAISMTERLELANARIGSIEQMRTIIRTDLYQLVPRGVYEPGTNRRRPSFLGGEALDEALDDRDGEPLLSLVRGGWPNPGAEEPRPEIQAVTYLVREDTLIRRTRPFLDAVTDTPYRDEVVLSGLSDVEIEFLEPDGWARETGRLLQPDEMTEAIVVKLSFQHIAYGSMEHLFLVGGEV